MKLATIPNGTRDGELVVVSADLTRAVSARAIAPNLLTAFEDWAAAEPRLRALAEDLAAGRAGQIFAFDQSTALSPLPRSFQWIDGSCFKNHLYLMARATGRDPEIEMNSPFPLMYQGMSDDFYRPHGDIPLPREEDNIDFEAEVGIVLDEVPMGTTAAEAPKYVKLVLLINDVSCRAYVKREITVGFGWMNAKPSTAFSPVAVTPDELGAAWTGKVELPIRIEWNGERFGEPNGREMSFSFYDLIEHAARTRKLAAGTIFGSGTVSNSDFKNVGSACIAERRSIEMLEHGEHRTSFMKFGDRVRIEMIDAGGKSIFGAIDQTVVQYRKVF
ncbi:fumarylacetoacetate hydrolase family protein [Rhizobium sp. ICMP 5592]|uniref:fumarylacetoacetate hydrolase family protein n=1 Tax=Rhizobium sp. ICMP 5592 TaxID=2292445 RepID=UPI0012960FA3|nr:fumarylacetoacetate hydrolase family protein [Rhizobium sp. ICMP 5592]MQB45932.1 FAA hydrolase family protein [Rhizobium sp. ICMP 5592]